MQSNSFYLQGSKEISLDDVLLARERRFEMQKKLLDGNSYTLLCFTLNIVGPYKVFPLVIKAFEEGLQLVKSSLNLHKIKIISHYEVRENTGYECFILVDEYPEKVKEVMIYFEEDNELGRLFDIDVLRHDGSKVSRTEMGYPSRRCLICDNEAYVCGRSRSHSVNELLNKEISIMNQYFEAQYADEIANMMTKALLYEVSTTPKPGLVDSNNSGSHKDMNLFTFIDSAMAILPFFKEFVLIGIHYTDDSLTKLFEQIRPIGMVAEKNMLKATNQINTHKGFIFSSGIICTALGYAYHNQMATDLPNICNICKEMVQLLEADFNLVTEDNIKYGIKGIRGEVINGFPAMQNIGMPTLKKYLKEGYSLNDAGAITLLYLIANLEDTNIISRSNYESMIKVQKDIENLLLSKTMNSNNLKEQLTALDDTFIQRNISPGGSADLLALCYFFLLYEGYPILHI